KKSVNMFLSEIIEDYEKIYRENIEYKDKINMLSEQIRQFNSMEETLKSTLLIAQKTAEEVTLNARRKSDIIIEEAEIKKNSIIQQAHEDVKTIKEEYEYLQKEIYIFKTRLESFLESQKLSLNEFYNDIANKASHDENNNGNETNEHNNEHNIEDSKSFDEYDLNALQSESNSQ
ncbi:MAG TPA: DivIVA domain-containing protein, partial [Soehngenia sp.]|nr:DivIVA domain-containing protein [Soehngenia sp.]